MSFEFPTYADQMKKGEKFQLNTITNKGQMYVETDTKTLQKLVIYHGLIVAHAQDGQEFVVFEEGQGLTHFMNHLPSNITNPQPSMMMLVLI